MSSPTPSPKRQRLSLVVADVDRPDRAPDLIDYFSQRGGRVRELEAECASLSEQNKTLRTDLEAAVAEVESIKETARIQAQTNKAMVDSYREEREATEEAYRREMGRTMDASTRLKQADSVKYAALERAEKAEGALAEARGSFRQEQLTMQASIGKLESQLKTAKQDADLARKLGTSPAKPAIQDSRLQELQRLIEEAEGRADGESAKRREMEVKLAELQSRAEAAEAGLREASTQLDGSNEEIITSLRSELRAQEAEIARARKIQSRAESLAVVHEKLLAAEAKLERAEKERSEVGDLRARVGELEAQIQAWEHGALGLGVETPAELEDKLQGLRAECLAAAAAASGKESELRRAREEAKTMEAARAEAEAALQSVQGANAELSAAAARFERRAALLTKEREGLQKLLASFHAEAQASGSELPAATQSAETEALRGQLAELQNQATTLEEALTAAAGEVKQAREQLADALAQAAASQAAKDRLQNEVERLEAEVGRLQGRVDRGEFNPAATRVLHYVLNPEAEARKEQQTARMQQLEAEVALLKVQLEQAAGAAAWPGGPSPETAVLRAEVVVLEQKVAEMAKREQRLKDVFQRQVANFREAVYHLFGYRVDMAAEAAAPRASEATSFVLRPQHASSSREQLVFQLRGGRMALVPTDFTSKKLKREVETFIDRFDSIPAFTANWTMELFQRQTQH